MIEGTNSKFLEDFHNCLVKRDSDGIEKGLDFLKGDSISHLRSTIRQVWDWLDSIMGRFFALKETVKGLSNK